MAVTDRLGAGRGPAFKYDLLSALGAHGCRGDKRRARLALRLMTLIVARYDWRTDRLTTGQAEIARLWGVDARTVKREMAALRGLGWLVLRVPSARGRVACHGLGIAAILADTRADWAAVGPDFEARLAGPPPEAPATQGAQVIPFPDEAQTGPWGALCERVRAVDAAAHATWIAPLRFVALDGGRLRLRAPSAFHASFVRTHHAATLVALGDEVTAVEVEV